MVDLLHAYMMVPWIAPVCASPVSDTSCGSPRRRAARREHGARNWRARLAGGTVSSRRTRPGPGGYGAVAAAGAQADPRADPLKELKEAGAPVAAGVGAGFSGFAHPAAPCQEEEEETPRACDTTTCLTAVKEDGQGDSSVVRVAFLALPAQLLHARRRRRHLEPATPWLASLRQTYDMDKYVQTQNHCSILEWKCNGSIIFHVGSTHVTDEETKEHSYLLTRTRFEAELRPVEQKLSALRSLLAQRPFFEVPSPLGAVDLYEYACGDEDLEPL
ncbi:uncharacterized protein LOC129394098 [Pan paniscus]|uniref:uncharacterized protein LOC129394098 n=1 Tax=Pan paniscus TaxID=9597 RepID=UPI0030063512